MRRFPLLALVVLACAITWSVWIPHALAAHGLIIDAFPAELDNLAYFVGPPLAAVLVIWRVYGWGTVGDLLRRLLCWRVRVRWYLLALLLRAGILALALTLGGLLGYLPLGNLAVFGTLASPALLLDCVARVFAHGGEEFAWRGYALPALQNRMSPFRASVLVALISGIWHAPLFFIPGKAQDSADFVGFLIWLVAIALIQTLLYNGTNGSLLIACLFHAALNTTTTHVPGVPALLDIIVTWLVALLLIRINTAQKQNLPPQLFPPPRGIP